MTLHSVLSLQTSYANRILLGDTSKFSRESPALYFAPASSIQRSKNVLELTRDCRCHVQKHMVPTNILLFSCVRQRAGILKWPRLKIAPLDTGSHQLLWIAPILPVTHRQRTGDSASIRDTLITALLGLGQRGSGPDIDHEIRKRTERFMTDSRLFKPPGHH